MSAAGYMIGTNMDSGISARCGSTFTMERSIIQRNKIHHPRYGSMSWGEAHPSGPNAVFFSECGGLSGWDERRFEFQQTQQRQ